MVPRYDLDMWWRKQPKRGHVAVVLLADPRDGSYTPYYVGQCDCGWLGDTFSEEASAFQQAREHAEQVDPEVRDTLSPDYKRREGSSFRPFKETLEEWCM